MDCDVVVVGAGLAGLRCATRLSGAGLDTVVLEAGDAVGGRVHRSLGSVEPIDDHTCRLRARGDSIEWLAYRILLLGVDFVVESPPELVDHLRAAASRIARSVAVTGTRWRTT